MTQEKKARRYDEVIEMAKSWYTDAQIDFKKSLESLFPELKEELKSEVIRKAIGYAIGQSTHSDDTLINGVSSEEALAWLEKQGEQKPTDEEMKELLKTEYEKGRADAITEMQKPAWSEDDENRINRLIAYFEDKESFTAEDDVVYANWLKSLKDRVQPKQEWSEEEEKIINGITNYLCSHDSCRLDGFDKWYDFLKFLKDRVLPQLKQEWSEEDESLRRRCIGAIDMANLSDYTKDSLLNWLKSLSPQSWWKPSEEQIEILDMVLTNESMDDNIARILRELQEALKKLKGE